MVKLNLILKKYFKGASFIFIVFGLVRCSNNVTTTASCESYTGTFTNIYSHMISTQCTSCHAPGKSPYSDGLTSLNLSTAALAYSSLTSSSTGRVSGASSGLACQNILYVQSASPLTSYVMAVLSDDYASNNFAGMSGCVPLNSHRTGLVNLCASDVSALSQWIQNGASNN